jgi:hypothetical protein
MLLAPVPPNGAAIFQLASLLGGSLRNADLSVAVVLWWWRFVVMAVGGGAVLGGGGGPLAFLVVAAGMSGDVVCLLHSRVLRDDGDFEREIIEGEMIGDDHNDNRGRRNSSRRRHS